MRCRWARVRIDDCPGGNAFRFPPSRAVGLASPLTRNETAVVPKDGAQVVPVLSY